MDENNRTTTRTSLNCCQTKATARSSQNKGNAKELDAFQETSSFLFFSISLMFQCISHHLQKETG